MSDKFKLAHGDGAPQIPTDFIIGVGHVAGTIEVNIGVHHFMYVEGGNVETVIVPTAHLRMAPQIARDLVKAVERVLDGLKRREN